MTPKNVEGTPYVSITEIFPQTGSECRVCGHPKQPPLQKYCSYFCKTLAEAFARFYNWQWIREKVLERDDYTCQRCGISKERWERAYWQVQEMTHDYIGEDGTVLPRSEVVEPPNGRFHVDHVVPQSKDGHPFDPENLQTLCEECNLSKSDTQRDYRDGEFDHSRMRLDAEQMLLSEVMD